MGNGEKEISITISWIHLIATAAIVVVVLVLWPLISPLFSPSLKLSTGELEYDPGDKVTIEGWARESWFTPFASVPVAIEVRGPMGVIWIDQTMTDGSGHFMSSFKLREDTVAGEYSVYASTEVVRALTTFRVRE
jgi:hypothetical protein